MTSEWLGLMTRQLLELEESLGGDKIKAKMYIHTGRTNLLIAWAELRKDEVDADNQRVGHDK